MPVKTAVAVPSRGQTPLRTRFPNVGSTGPKAIFAKFAFPWMTTKAPGAERTIAFPVQAKYGGTSGKDMTQPLMVKS
jgi:hypothetical protein